MYVIVLFNLMHSTSRSWQQNWRSSGYGICPGALKKSRNKWARSWGYGTYHTGDQRKLRRACASAQSRQSLRCSLTWRMEVDEGSDQNKTFNPTGWLRMRAWKMSLRRTKSTIISWDDSNKEVRKMMNLDEKLYIMAKKRNLISNGRIS